jgi:opacity protein-like surface antigen
MTKTTLIIIQLLCFSLTAFAGSAIENIVDKNKNNSRNGFFPSSLKGHSFGLGLGQTFLHGDFSKNGQNSITVDAYYEYKASYSFDLLINGHFSGHKMGEKESNITGIAAGIKGKIMNFDAFTPYFVGGLGFYLPKVTRVIDNNIVESDSKVTFGTHFGLGADLELNQNYTVGLIAHVHNPFDVEQELLPEVQGFYYKLLFTLFYKF